LRKCKAGSKRNTLNPDRSSPVIAAGLTKPTLDLKPLNQDASEPLPPGP